MRHFVTKGKVSILREWLKRIRKEMRYAPKEIAEKCDITRNYYDLIETGKRNPSVSVAQKIADLLNFDWTWFFNPPGDAVTNANTVNIEILQHK